MNIYVYSDPHFGHENIIKYCNRPFKDANEMDEALIKKYNHIIRDEDIVYFLGDLGNINNINILKGTKILVKGNHDKESNKKYYDAGFSLVVESLEIKVGKKYVTMNHYPVRTLKELLRVCRIYFFETWFRHKSIEHAWNRVKRELRRYYRINKNGDIHLCGHVHNAWIYNGKNINCSVDVWDYKPIKLNKLLNRERRPK